MDRELEAAVARHYGAPELLQAILGGLAAAGADVDAPSLEALAPVDEFHTAGRAATLVALGEMALRPGMRILDAGSGLGGAARLMARDHGCRVEGIDLTPHYVDVARALTARTGLDGLCRFRQASVTDIPFADRHFDGAISFHVAMNVADRHRFYDELARVLRPGAPLCIFDVMKGPARGMRYPVPWAETADTSFLTTPGQIARLLEQAGFRVDRRKSLRKLAQEHFAAAPRSAPPLGLHLLTGGNSADKFANYVRALEDRQIDPVMMLALRR